MLLTKYKTKILQTISPKMLQTTHIFIQQLYNSQSFYSLTSKITVFEFLFLNN